MTATTASAAAPAGARESLAGTHPTWATAHAMVSSKPVTTGAVTANVYLADRDAAGLTAYATAVSTPSNKLYGHYLTAAQAQARYAPTAAESAAVKAWAKNSGLSVTTSTSGFGAYVSVNGSAAAVAKAFSVTFGSYKVGKATYRAPEQAASVPASVASSVMTVTGLDSAKSQMKPAETLPPPPQNYFVAPDCSTYYGQLLATKVPGTSTSIPKVDGKAQPWTGCGYTPAQIRGAYHVSTSGETGKGVTVAVVDAYAAPTMSYDASEYAKVTGDKGYKSGQYSEVRLGGTNGWTDTDACGANGWYGEEALDVESVHGQAPDANIVYVGAKSCDDDDLGAALAYIVNHHTASIVTDSWGEPANDSTTQAVYDNTFKAGAAEGIGFFFSSGDSGYEDPAYEEDPSISNEIQADYPTSSPWVTSVGGTSLAIGAKNNYEFETAWGTIVDPLTTTSTGASAWTYNPPAAADNIQDFYNGSGGGGVSTEYTQPWYQKGVVPSSLATDVPEGTTSTPMRVEPDVSALADASTGFLVGETLFGPNNSPEKFYLSRIGGTSLASPTFAGIEADAQQGAGHAIGFANPAIYGLDRLNSFTHTFNDVVNHTGVYQVRSNYTDPYNEVGPLVTYLRELGVNGTGASALNATHGYDDATGVGSPDYYVQAFKLLGLLTGRR
ncbi:MAG TPA: S53 family peptidase [Trebonia sp.]|nr:S53 family peptidase [Trebonia sp.]